MTSFVVFSAVTSPFGQRRSGFLVAGFARIRESKHKEPEVLRLQLRSVAVVELKACKAVAQEHVAQLLGYMKSARIETGLLINFGAAKLHVKKYLMTGKK